MKPQKTKSNLEHKKEKNNTVVKSQEHVDDENKIPNENIADRHCLAPATDAIGSCCSKFKYIFAILLIPPFLNYVALLQEAKQLMPKGAMYDVGFGRKMFMRCNGSGLPTVIMDAPAGMSSDVWSVVFEDLSKITKVCMYDRAGLGFSERPYQQKRFPAVSISSLIRSGLASEEHPAIKTCFKLPWIDNCLMNQSSETGRNRQTYFTVESMVDDLHQLITYSSQQPRPLLFLSAEMGALIARFYAQIYEGDVSDIVLVNPLTEELFTGDSNVWTEYWSKHLIPTHQGLQLMAAVGLSRLLLITGMFAHPLVNSSTELDLDTHSRIKHLTCNPRHLSSAVDELFFINETFSQMKTVFMMKSFPKNISMTVINTEVYDNELSDSLNTAWARSQQGLIARLHPGSSQISVANVDRMLFFQKPSTILEPVKRIVQQYRTKSRQFPS